MSYEEDFDRSLKSQGLYPLLQALRQAGITCAEALNDTPGDIIFPRLPPSWDTKANRTKWVRTIISFIMDLATSIPPHLPPAGPERLAKAHARQADIFARNLHYQYRRLKPMIRALLVLTIADDTAPITTPTFDVVRQLIEVHCIPCCGTSSIPQYVTIVTNDDIRFMLAQEIAMQGTYFTKLIGDMTKENSNNNNNNFTFRLEDVNGRTFERACEFLAHHQFVPLRSIPRPLRRPFREVIDKWDYDYFRHRLLENNDDLKNRDLQLVVTAASKLGFSELRNFCCAALGSLILQRKSEEEIYDLFGARGKVKPEHYEKLFQQYPYLDNRKEVEALKESSRQAETARKRLEEEEARRAEKEQKKGLQKALRQQIQDLKASEISQRKAVEEQALGSGWEVLMEEHKRERKRIEKLLATIRKKKVAAATAVLTSDSFSPSVEAGEMNAPETTTQTTSATTTKSKKKGAKGGGSAASTNQHTDPMVSTASSPPPSLQPLLSFLTSFQQGGGVSAGGGANNEHVLSSNPNGGSSPTNNTTNNGSSPMLGMGLWTTSALQYHMPLASKDWRSHPTNTTTTTSSTTTSASTTPITPVSVMGAVGAWDNIGNTTASWSPL